MTEEVFHRLQKARQDAGYRSAREAAETLGWSISTYSSHENGSRGIKPDQAKKYARTFRVTLSWLLTGEDGNQLQTIKGVPLFGEVAAGLWREVDVHIDDAQDIHVPAVPDPRFPLDYQVALRVRGPSMNKVIDDGAFAIGVLYDRAPRRAQDGDIVVIRRVRAGLVETTLKRYRRIAGQDAFFPESTDHRFQEPVRIEAEEDDTVVEIFALVIGTYRPLI